MYHFFLGDVNVKVCRVHNVGVKSLIMRRVKNGTEQTICQGHPTIVFGEIFVRESGQTGLRTSVLRCQKAA